LTLDIIEQTRDLRRDLERRWLLSLSWDRQTMSTPRSPATRPAIADPAEHRELPRDETDRFACNDHFGITAGFLQGDYTVQLSATSGEIVLNETPVILDSKRILDRNRITDLGTVSIPVGNR
jgi:hypothetical protein